MLDRVIELKITDDGLLDGVDGIAFVEKPAIELEFLAFNREEFESYNDYPEKVKSNAKRGIELNKENGNKCATQVVKVRAQQLANGENVSLDTIRRMRAFLIRQKDNYELARNRKDYSACGYISYLLWGGEEAIGWAEKKLRQAGEEFEELSAVEKEIFEGILAEKILANAIKKDDEKYFENIDDETQDDIIDALKEVGVKMDDFANFNTLKGSSNPNQKTILDRGDRRVLFRYTRADGSMTLDGKERDFCSKMVALSKQGYLWRKEDINSLTIKKANDEFGVYDLFAYKGSYGCRHKWTAVEFKEETADNMTKKDTKRPLAVLDGYISAGTTLNKDIVRKMFSQDDLDEQQIVATPIMVPNKLIPRRDEQGDYHVFFTENTIKQIAYKFAEIKANDNINHEHDSDSPVDGVYLAESWIVEEPTNDKSNTFGYELPKGSWFGLFKVKNKEYWNDYIKTGKVKGVSVEGMFLNQLTELS